MKDEAPKNYGRSDITVYEHRRTPRGTLIRHRFLIVQCKRVSFETQDAVWAEAEEQLDEYLASTHQYTQPVNRTPVYGAVAVAGRLLSINTTTTAAINLTGILRAHTGMIYKLHIISHI